MFSAELGKKIHRTLDEKILEVFLSWHQLFYITKKKLLDVLIPHDSEQDKMEVFFFFP